MIYQRIYDSIISRARHEEQLGVRRRGNGTYYERHHILPRSLFPGLVKEKSNIVLLTAREHFVCHRLLTRIYPVSQMFYALWRMCCGKEHGHLKISSKKYAKIREECCRNIDWKEHGRRIQKSWNEKSSEERRLLIEKHKQTVSNWSEEKKRSIYENRNTDYLTDPVKRAAWNEKKKQGSANRSKEEKQASLQKWRMSLQKSNDERKRKISQTLKNKTPEQKMQKRLKEAATRAAWSEERKLECSRKRSERQSKYLWWNNGVVNKMSEMQPGPDFVPGRLPFKKNK